MIKKTAFGVIIAFLLLSISATALVLAIAELKPVDVNGDGKVDGEDVILVAHALGSYPEHSRWNSDADINNDEIVNAVDIILVARSFGQTFP